MFSKPIRLSDFDVKPNAKVVISGDLAFANITRKNMNTQYTPTYGLTIDNPVYTTPDTDQNSFAFKNDANLAHYLNAHERRELDRHGRARLHVTWKDGGKLKNQHMPIAGKKNAMQLRAVDSGNLLAKRDSDNHVLGNDGKPILVNGKPVTNVNMVSDADDKVAFNSLNDGQHVQVTYVSFESKHYDRLGSTIRALVVPDLDNLDLYSKNDDVKSFGLTPDGDQTIDIKIRPQSRDSSH